MKAKTEIFLTGIADLSFLEGTLLGLVHTLPGGSIIEVRSGIEYKNVDHASHVRDHMEYIKAAVLAKIAPLTTKIILIPRP